MTTLSWANIADVAQDILSYDHIADEQRLVTTLKDTLLRTSQQLIKDQVLFINRTLYCGTTIKKNQRPNIPPSL